MLCIKSQTSIAVFIVQLKRIEPQTERCSSFRTKFPSKKLRYLLHSQKRAGCSKSAARLLPCGHQADIRMRSHRLLRIDTEHTEVELLINYAFHPCLASALKRGILPLKIVIMDIKNGQGEKASS